MLVSQLHNKKIAIVGMGLTGQSCARFLLRHGISATGFDTRSLDAASFSIPCQFGQFAKDVFLDFDVLLVSPGISLQTPAIQAAIANQAIISSDIGLFAANFNKPIIGITGSNGKSTVVSMLQDIFSTAGVKVACGGNIGLPALDLLEADYDLAVLELSSFQLETVSDMPLQAAAILNISEDHMDRYPDFQAYCDAKLSIYDNAQFRVANKDDPNTWPANRPADAFCRKEAVTSGFGLQLEPAAITLDAEPYLFADELKVSGMHNLLNMQVACIIARHCGVAEQHIKSAMRAFKGLPHRCQIVSTREGVTWVNDSKATNVGATIAAIEGLRPVVHRDLWLIAGGDAKQADLSPLQPYLERDVNHLITLGRDGHLIAALTSDSFSAASLQDAVSIAAEGSKSGDMVLLSPACASLDMFDNYQHRGEVFMRAVEELV